MEPIVKISNLNVTYNLGKINEFCALDNINLEIYPGEYVTFFGPSGCGKSTLLYTIAGLETPTSGEVVVDHKNTKQMKTKEMVDFHRHTIGMVFQAYYLIPHLNIINNVTLPKIFSKIDKNERTNIAKEIMKRFDIIDLAKRKPSQLSGGQQQRVAIARALVNNPSILLADEPVGNLDSKNSEIVLKLINDIHKIEKKTIIHVSHNPKDLQFSDKIFYMRDGRIEKIVENKKASTTASDQLSKNYPYLNQKEIESKLILNQVISEYSVETQIQMEKTICRYINGEINQKDLVNIFDRPAEDGGFNLYTQSARKLGQSIIDLVDKVKIFSQEKQVELPINKRVQTIMSYLIDKYHLNLNYDQTKRLKELLIDRFNFKLSEPRFNQKIVKSLNNGGIGINKRTAAKLFREVKIIMFNKRFKQDEN